MNAELVEFCEQLRAKVDAKFDEVNDVNSVAVRNGPSFDLWEARATGASIMRYVVLRAIEAALGSAGETR